jgi:hypothetical protein
MRNKILCILIILLMLSTGFAIMSRSDNVKYMAAGRRDPFVPLVGADRPVNAGLENISSVEDLKLEGIAISPNGKSRAIINGEIVKERQVIGSLEIKKISKKEVIILLGGKKHALTLSEEGGKPGGK